MSKPELRSLEETARFFEVSVPTVRGWINDGGCPVHERGSNGVAYQLDLRAVAAWHKQRHDAEELARAERQKTDGQLKLELLGPDALTGEDETTLSARARAEMLRAEFDRTKLAQLRRELVPAADIKIELVAIAGRLRDQLRAMPDRLASRHGLPDSQVEALSKDIDDMLDQFADDIANLEAPADDAAQAA